MIVKNLSSSSLDLAFWCSLAPSFCLNSCVSCLGNRGQGCYCITFSSCLSSTWLMTFVSCPLQILQYFADFVFLHVMSSLNLHSCLSCSTFSELPVKSYSVVDQKSVNWTELKKDSCRTNILHILPTKVHFSYQHSLLQFWQSWGNYANWLITFEIGKNVEVGWFRMSHTIPTQCHTDWAMCSKYRHR